MHTVRLKDGKRVKVRPVFELMRERVNEYSLDRVAEITGVHQNNIARVAREFAAAKSAMIYSSWGACKHFHSDLFQRGMAYLCALTGNSGGKPGSGIKVVDVVATANERAHGRRGDRTFGRSAIPRTPCRLPVERVGDPGTLEDDVRDRPPWAPSRRSSRGSMRTTRSGAHSRTSSPTTTRR